MGVCQGKHKRADTPAPSPTAECPSCHGHDVIANHYENKGYCRECGFVFDLGLPPEELLPLPDPQKNASLRSSLSARDSKFRKRNNRIAAFLIAYLILLVGGLIAACFLIKPEYYYLSWCPYAFLGAGLLVALGFVLYVYFEWGNRGRNGLTLTLTTLLLVPSIAIYAFSTFTMLSERYHYTGIDPETSCHYKDEGLGRTVFLDAAKKLVIPTTLLGKPVTSYEWLGDTSKITSVSFGEGTTELPSRNFAFKLFDLPNLEEIDLSGIAEIPNDYFHNFRGLKKVTFSESLKRIGKSAFENTSLLSLELPEGIETIDERAFYGCGNVERVTLPKSLKTLGNDAFAACSKLLFVGYCKDHPADWDRCFPKELIPYVVKEAGVDYDWDYAWDNRRYPETAYLALPVDAAPAGTLEEPGLITAIGAEKATALSLLLLVGDGAIADYSFAKCTGLHNIAIMGKARIGEGAFLDCANLTEIQFGETIAIGMHAFAGCSNVASLNLPSCLERLEAGCFGKMEKIVKLELPYGIRYIGGNLFGLFHDGVKMGSYYPTSAVQFSFANPPAGTDSPEGPRQFSSEASSSSMKTSSRATSSRSSSSTSSSTSTRVESNGIYFIPKNGRAIFSADGSTLVHGFSRNTYYSEMYPEVKPFLHHIGEFAFAGISTNMGTIFNTDIATSPDLRSIGAYAFYKSNVSSGPITIDSDFADVIGPHAFDSVYGTRITIDYKPFSSVGQYAFARTDVQLGRVSSAALLEYNTLAVNGAFKGATESTAKSVADHLDRLVDGVFEDSPMGSFLCPALSKSIGAYSFRNCGELFSFTIANYDLESIGYAAFEGCEKLTDIQYVGTKEQWEAIAKHKDWLKGSSIVTVHCSDGDVVVAVAPVEEGE